MKNKGFTLPEVLAVVIVISLLSVVAITQITNRVNSAKGKINDAQEQIIYTAAQLYIDENRLLFNKKENNVYCIYIEEIIQSGYLSSPIFDMNGNEISYDTKIKAHYINGKFDFTYNPDTCEEQE